MAGLYQPWPHGVQEEVSSLSLNLPSVQGEQVEAEEGCWPGGQEGAVVMVRAVDVKVPLQLIIHDPVGGVWEVDVILPA